MGGFTRRFSQFPGVEQITAIEGVVIVDAPPPGAIQGVGEGVACCIGEFQDMTFAVAFNPATGVFSSKPQPVEIFSGTDFATKLGGFDSTIGEIGKSGGNGFISLRNKQYTRLIAVPINLASAVGARLFRKLPTNASATDPSPVVAVVAANVPAGTEFKSGANRVRIAKAIQFAGGEAIVQGTDGSVVAGGGPAEHQTFTSAGATFQTSGIKVGHIIVVGVIGAAGAQGANADTYRVQAVTSETVLELEMMDGSNFNWTTGAALAWRAHAPTTADTGVASIANAGAVGDYNVPVRPLDATIAAAALLTPTIVPPALTATTADPLSGLEAAASPAGGGIVFDGNVQAPNAANSAALDALYVLAINAINGNDDPAPDINIPWTARHSSTIRSTLLAAASLHAKNAKGCVAVVAPGLDTQDLATVLGDADPGVGANRSDRVVYGWPGIRTFVPEAAEIALGTADGATTSDGILDVAFDSTIASIMSNIAPERNPGQGADPVPTIMASVVGLQRGAPSLGISEYIRLRAKGVAAPKRDVSAGWVIQSGITTSLVSGEKNIARRRMADFIEDSLADSLQPYIKLPLTQQLKDQITAEIQSFLTQLLSPNNPSAQRISDFQVDSKSGNTPDLESQGIFVEIVRVRTLASDDFLVLQAEIGEGVTINQIAA